MVNTISNQKQEDKMHSGEIFARSVILKALKDGKSRTVWEIIFTNKAAIPYASVQKYLQHMEREGMVKRYRSKWKLLK